MLKFLTFSFCIIINFTFTELLAILLSRSDSSNYVKVKALKR